MNLEIFLGLKHTSYFLHILLRATSMKIPEVLVLKAGSGRGTRFRGNNKS
jgi:hypothetical protein